MQVILGVAAGIMVIGMLCTWGVSVIKNKNCIRHEKKGHLEIQNKRENKKVSEDSGKDKVNFKDSIERNTTSMQNTAEVLHQKEKISISQKNCGETVVLSANIVTGPATLVSREPGELATIYLQNELTVIGKMENAADAVIELPTVSRIHAKIRKREGEYYLTDLNSRNGTSVNGKILKGDEEYCLQDQDQIDFAQARYVFLSNMDYAQVSAAVITQEFIDGIQNDYLMEVVSRYPDRFFVCGMCEFRKPGYLEQAKELIGKGFKAIKIPAQRLLLKEGRVMLNCPEMMQMFRWMEERGVILSVDLAEGAIQVLEMEEIIQECPRLKIAVGHFGMVTLPDWKEQIKLARHPNVMIESGGITWLFNDEFYPFKGAIKAIREAAELVGMEKLMWGSDYPRTITAITYKMSYDFVVKSPELSEAEKTLFLGGNARKFYGFAELPELPYIKNMSE